MPDLRDPEMQLFFRKAAALDCNDVRLKEALERERAQSAARDAATRQALADRDARLTQLNAEMARLAAAPPSADLLEAKIGAIAEGEIGFEAFARIVEGALRRDDDG